MSQQDVRSKKYRQYLDKGKSHESSGDRKGALHQYRLALQKLRDIIRDETNRTVKRKRLTNYRVLEKKVEQLSREAVGSGKSFDGGIKPRPEGDVVDEVEDFDEREFETLINGCIEKSHIQWDDISGLDGTKQIIKESIVLALAQKESGLKIEGWSNILLYGPPGTGKTLMAAATSNGLGATFFNVKISSVLSKYVGDSPKILSTLFRRAREEAPSVIFIDEVENLVESREAGRQASTGLVQSFLAELDGFSRKSDDEFVLFIAATNVPWEVDNAILNRFEKRILIPLPDRAARVGILGIHIDMKGYSFAGNMATIITKTEGYSGRDIRNLCKDVSIRMIREMNPAMSDLADDVSSARGYHIQTRPITMNDFRESFRKFKPTTTPEILIRIEEWKKNFGSE